MGQEPLNIVLCNETLHIFHRWQFKEICKFVDGCIRKVVWLGNVCIVQLVGNIYIT